MVQQLPKSKSSYIWVLFTTNLFLFLQYCISWRSCQFTGKLVRSTFAPRERLLYKTTVYYFSLRALKPWLTCTTNRYYLALYPIFSILLLCIYYNIQKNADLYSESIHTCNLYGLLRLYHIHVNTVTLLVHTYWYAHNIILYIVFVFQWHFAIRNLCWLLKGVIYYCNNTVEYLSGTALSAVCIGSAKLWIECFFKFIFNIITICSVAACLFYSFIVFKSCRV